MKKILLTGARGMLGTDFIKHFGDRFGILPLDRNNGDITNMESMDTLIKDSKPDVILNFAAYTNVEDSEDVGMKSNFDVNALGAYNLAKISAKYAIDLITISTDYVFDGTKKEGYTEDDVPNPINSYGMAKYLGERLVRQENPNAIIIRTSRLYGGGPTFKNFVNTMLKLSETKKELKIVNDQYGNPTYTIDLNDAIVTIFEKIDQYRGKILHLSNSTQGGGITWFDFAKKIFSYHRSEIIVVPCTSDDFPNKAARPEYSKLLSSAIQLRDREKGLTEYLRSIEE